MSPTGSDASARGAAAMPDARLDALDAAAVGLLEPLIHATDVDVVGLASAPAAGPGGAAPGGTGPGASAGGWRIGLASALDRLAEAALDLELIGLGHAVGLLRAHLLGVARPDDVALELASAEGWVSDAIAFCSGQLPVDEAPSLIERLRDWPGLAERVTPDLVAPIASRLRQDAERIAAATIVAMQASHAADDLREPLATPPEEGLAPMAAGLGGSEAAPEAAPEAAKAAALAVGADELAMLAEAAGQLEEEFAPALAGDAGEADRTAHAARIADSLEAGADAIERFANAVGYIGLVAVSAVLETFARTLHALASEPARFDDRHRRLLAQVAPAWVRLFREPSPQAAREALGPLGDSAWPIPAHRESIDAALAQFASLATVASRRVAAAEQPVDERDLSLQIPLDADRSVVENLLRELPALSAEFSSCIDRMASGSGDAIASAQRVAHTLKGSANTVGVRGIAVLTHQLEDLLQLLEPVDGGLSAELIDVLADAADCVAEMSESVAGLGPAPDGALGVLRRVRDWTNRLLQDPAAAIATPAGARPAPAAAAEPAAVEASPEAGKPVASAVPTAPAEAVERDEKVERVEHVEPAGYVEPAEAAQGAPAQEWLRVPASLIERLLAFANEASILLSQAQEQAVEVDRVRATLRTGTDQLQDLAGELERLVDVRGTALSERRAREDFDALELDEYNDLHTVSRRIAESGADGRLIEQQLGGNVAALRDSLSQLERIQVDLREAALQTRTVRVDTVVPRWRRTVRQAARMAGHDVSLQVDGEATEIDAQLLQSMVEPIAHLLRNAVDHGIEPPAQRQALGKPPVGRIVLAFARDGADLVVECSDDGRGLDPQAVRERATALGLLEAGEPCDDAALARFVLIPGFSTRARATQLSGRGIGLDVVNQAVREQRGVLDIASTPGQGMRVRLRVPVRLAAVPVIVVRSPSHVLALEVRDVEEILTADRIFDDADGVRRFHGAAGPIRLVRLEDALGLPVDAFAPPPGVEPAAPAVLQVRMPGGERVAMLVAEAGQTRNVVVRPLASFVPPIPGVDGAAVLGDGAVAPVIDLPQLLAARQDAQAAPALDAARRAAPVCLVVDDSVSVRRTMELFARDLGYEVDSAADGIDALERVARRVPALVLVDLEMPRMNGVELVRALRERPDTRAVPVIMITSRSSEKHRRLALDAGVDVFLTKPYTEDALAGHIAQLVHRR
ncbi:MAG: response regulator [Burkholderiaceae bacterium]|nr:response regulator [Burkholderiaceae bacterium]